MPGALEIPGAIEFAHEAGKPAGWSAASTATSRSAASSAARPRTTTPCAEESARGLHGPDHPSTISRSATASSRSRTRSRPGRARKPRDQDKGGGAARACLTMVGAEAPLGAGVMAGKAPEDRAERGKRLALTRSNCAPGGGAGALSDGKRPARARKPSSRSSPIIGSGEVVDDVALPPADLKLFADRGAGRRGECRRARRHDRGGADRGLDGRAPGGDACAPSCAAARSSWRTARTCRRAW